MVSEIPEQVKPLIASIKKLGGDIHTLKELQHNYPAMEKTYREMIDDLVAIRDQEFVILGRDTFARLAGSLT